jgi:predicted lipoprotein with Yx(FWY)xxD motif
MHKPNMLLSNVQDERPKERIMMSRRSGRIFLAGGALVALAAVALAACGSSGGTSTASTQLPKTSTGTPATVGVTRTSLGNILVDAQGRTLYLFQSDSGSTSTCTGSCATFWPPLIAPGAPTSGSGANVSLIGTTKRQDGKSQVTYNGHPVYLYSGDHNPGDTNGQGVVAFGAGWFALSPSGAQVSGSSSNTGSGSGIGY